MRPRSSSRRSPRGVCSGARESSMLAHLKAGERGRFKHIYV